MDLPRVELVPAQLPDRVQLPDPHDVRLSGFLGERVASNAAHLAAVDLEPLLAGFRQRPGTHPWIGEHIGKWLDAATLAWDHTGDAALRAKIDGAVRALIATQEADGYLGTYRPDQRFGLHIGADWDVWVHTYCLAGLLTYHRYTGNEAALDACRSAGDLLDRVFRTGPEPRRIIDAGTHVGMAATSVLEPLVLLYRATGTERYLELARTVVRAWDEPRGPRILSTLRESGRVALAGNGKAYEMLANLVGLCELARATGDRTLLAPLVAAWEDIVANHRYITGGASFAEHFQRPHELPNPMSPNVAETCVTVTWLQLSLQLLRMLGEARYADEIERTAYNHLLAAQHPDGRTWCYYTALEGTKPYGPGISCCVSSGPRGVALLPTAIAGWTGDAIAVNLYETSTIDIDAGERRYRLTQLTRTPFDDGTDIHVTGAGAEPVILRLRIPGWASGFRVPEHPDARVADGWLVVPSRRYTPEAAVHVEFQPRSERVAGDHGNRGKVALTYGPFVLAYATDEDRRRRTPAFDVIEAARPTATLSPDADRVEVAASISNRVDLLVAEPVTFVPFVEAGADGRPYRTWLSATDPELPISLLAAGRETRSSGTIAHGSAIDYEPYSFVSTYDGQEHAEEWIAVTLERPVSIGRIVIGHGWSWVNGGWFDTAAGKPVVEIRRGPRDGWQHVGDLADYPSTTASDPGGLVGGETFSIVLTEPIQAVAVRVRGRGSSGDYPPQRYVTCSMLAAYPA